MGTEVVSICFCRDLIETQRAPETEDPGGSDREDEAQRAESDRSAAILVPGGVICERLSGTEIFRVLVYAIFLYPAFFSSRVFR